MNDLKKIKIYTILIHSFIIIGAGHGIGILLFFDYLSIVSLFENGLEYNLNAEYQDRLMLVGLISIIGKIILIISIFIKQNVVKNSFSFVGVLLLWISVYALTSGSWDYDSLYEISFWTSVPFLIASLVLVFYIFQSSNKRII